MSKHYFIKYVGSRLNNKTSFAPVVLFLLAFLMSTISGISSDWPIDIFGWLAISFLLASFVLFAAQILLGVYHLLTGKGGNQGTITDLKLPDKLHKKTSFLPIVMIASGLFIMAILIFNMNDYSNEKSFLEMSLFFSVLILVSLGSIMLVWNFLFGVYSLIRDITKSRTTKND